MHAYIHINKHNKNQKEKKLGVACSAVPTMNEKDETCSVLYSTLTYSRQLRAWLCDTRDYRGPDSADSPLIYTVRVSYAVRREVSVVANPDVFK
jgi:hypothetical protein